MASKWLLAAEAALAAGSLSQPRANSANSAKRSEEAGGEGDFGTNGTNGTPPGEIRAPSLPEENTPNRFSRANSAFSAKNLDEDIERAAIVVEGDGSDATQDWPALFRESLITFRALRPEHEAHRLAWGKIMNAWHMKHGERIPPHLCAGCRKPIGNAKALDLMDGCRVHDDTEYECLLRYGQHWRGEAARALEAAGCPGRGHASAQIAEFPTSRRGTGT
jgi:hypothetical protein